MSASGQTRRLGHVGDMSGLPQTADISGSGRHFAFCARSRHTRATVPSRRPVLRLKKATWSEVLRRIVSARPISELDGVSPRIIIG
jgi:hypothetical protein